MVLLLISTVYKSSIRAFQNIRIDVVALVLFNQPYVVSWFM